VRVIVCGSRAFTDYKLMKEKLDKLLANLWGYVILSGHAKGADLLGERYAGERWVNYEVFHPDYSKGKNAPILRNAEMVDSCTKRDVLIAFWDLKSPGTRDIVARARKKGMRVRVVKF
jgi:hypothetical protein